MSKKVNNYTDLSDVVKLDLAEVPVPQHHLNKTISQEIRIATIGNVDAGKCLAYGTLVHMADGTIQKAEDLDIGQMVMGEDAIPSTITYLETGKSHMLTVNKICPHREGSMYHSTTPLFKVTPNHKLTFRVNYSLSSPFNKHSDMMSAYFIHCDANDKLSNICIVERDLLNFVRMYSRCKHNCLRQGQLIDITAKDYLNLNDNVRQCLQGINQLTGEYFPVTVTLDNYDLYDYVGVEIDHPTQRFMIEGGILTHNSTTLGVIKSQQPDNGSGLRRKGIFKHDHERESGRTSDVSNQYLQYNERLYSFSDLAGHEGYLKTTIYGLVSTPIDWAMLHISANQGIEQMTREHLSIVVQLKLNMFIVVTKNDISPPNVTQNNLKTIQIVMKKIKRNPIFINTLDDLKNYYELVSDVDNPTIMDTTLSNKYVPIFLISNVTMGLTHSLLQTFIFNIRSHYNWKENVSKEPVYIVDRTYTVKGTGLVISGIVKKGVFQKDKTYKLGPFNDKYYDVIVRNIRDNTETDIPHVSAGYSACFAIRAKDVKNKEQVSRAMIQKGMILTTNPSYTQTFKAEIRIVHHPTRISVGYEPHLHCGGLKRTMKILSMDKEDVKAGDKTNVVMTFKGNPCYVEVGDKFIFREGRTRGSGSVLKLIK